MAQPGGGCFRCPQSAEAYDLGIRQIKLLRNQRYLILRHCMFLPISLSPLSGEETVMEGREDKNTTKIRSI
uniref:Uncharacterized protein n=1 Tax=Oryza meridionalis TaxID=40149 RepID=A0A0E0CL40_9ORYZ